MKKICSLILTFAIVILSVSTASAAYTLPEKMDRQLQVGSGLKGSVVIYANADAELNPLVHSIQNAGFEIRGIRYEGNQHYYFYQPGEGETLNALTELSRIDGRYYLRSDFLGDGCMILPTADHLINAALKSEGENVSIFPDLLRAFLFGETENELNTESLERTVEMWINAFSTETSVQSGSGSPKLNQTFVIPVEEAYSVITEVIRQISSSENFMGYFREILSKEQIDLYLNPNLGYYYTDAMKQLDMKGEIRFTRTVSTLGELITSSLYLPLDAEKTGYESVTLQNDEKNKSIFLTGPSGVIYIQLPLGADLVSDDYENAEIRFVKIDNINEDAQNVALKITAARKAEKTEDAAENRIHEKTVYHLNIVRDTDGLPEGINTDTIPDMAAADADITIHYSSKPQLSSPTTLEVTCNITHGRFSFSLEGTLKTASPWVFAPFSIDGAKDAGSYSFEDLKETEKIWIRNAEEKLVRLSGTVSPEAGNEDSADPAEEVSETGAPDTAENGTDTDTADRSDEGPEPVSEKDIPETGNQDEAEPAESNSDQPAG